MPGRTWRNVNSAKADKIKSYLLENGGTEEKVKSDNEIWRIRFSDSTFTFYEKGTIYSTPSNSIDPSVLKAWEYINSIVESAYLLPTKEFLIGLDETGKGEVIGHTILTGVIFPRDLFGEIDKIIGPADTKKRRSFAYWDEVFKKLDDLRNKGLTFFVEKIPPWDVDRYNLNKIMDISYQRILSTFFRNIDISSCRVVLDDYGVGPTLERFLKFLEKQGAEIVVTHNSEDKYLEVKIASLISKRAREAVIKAIRESPEYQIEDLSIGSGNANDEQTMEWLNKWYSANREWPWFIKRSFAPIRKIEGKTGKPKKMTPPIREELLSRDFLDEFDKGKLSIRSLSMVCPYCGSILKSVRFFMFKEGNRQQSGIKCPKCERPIENAAITLRYYCGYIVPDSSVIQRSLISQDLNASRFFENFTIVLSSIVRKECNGTTKGKKEFEALWKYNSIGRIKLESFGKVEDIPEGLPNTVKDEKIIEACIDFNAILLTADKSMSAFAGSKNIFTILV